MYDFNRINEELMTNSQDCPTDSAALEAEELYILHCLFHRLSVSDIDFSKFSLPAVESALYSFQDSVRHEDEDEMIRFHRDSAWATTAYMAAIMWNFKKTPAKRDKPPFPLI